MSESVSTNRPARTKWTPSELAARWGISESRVLYWIHTGQLRAIDAADDPATVPDCRVDIADVVLFEDEREIQPIDARRAGGGR